MLVDQLEDLEPPAIGGGIELEAHGPHLIGMFSLVALHRIGLRFTVQPHRAAADRPSAGPNGMCSAAIPRRHRRSLASTRTMTLRPWRWVLLFWPTTRPAQCSETRNMARRARAALRRLSGLDVSRGPVLRLRRAYG